MSRRDAAWFFLCFWTGCALHMMFVFMGAVYLGVLVWMKRRGTLQLREHVRVWAWWIPAFLLLGGHYLHVLLNAPEVNAEEPLVMESILVIGYYFAGLNGLGWSRNALRSMNLELSWRIVAGTGLFLLSAAAVAVCCIRRRGLLKSRIVVPAACIAGSMILFVLSGAVLRLRFWERHIIYLLPGCILVVVMVCETLRSAPRDRVARIATGCLLALWIVSGVDVVTMKYYRKDDYRGAAELARSFHPDHILFQGDAITFRYYGLEGGWAETLAAGEEAGEEAGEGAEDAGETAPEDTDETAPEDAPLESNVNISPATPEMMGVLARRLNGRCVLILSEKDDFDKGGLYRAASGLSALRVESFLILPVESLADDLPAGIVARDTSDGTVLP